MDNIINTKIDRLEQTNEKILDVLKSINSEMTGIKSEITGIKTEITGIKSEITGIKTEITGMKSEITGMKSEITGIKTELADFRSETQEQFAFFAETAVTKTEFDQAIHDIRCEMATKDQFMHFTDRLDAKFLDLKHDIIAGIRAADKKFLKFAI